MEADGTRGHNSRDSTPLRPSTPLSFDGMGQVFISCCPYIGNSCDGERRVPQVYENCTSAQLCARPRVIACTLERARPITNGMPTHARARKHCMSRTSCLHEGCKSSSYSSNRYNKSHRYNKSTPMFQDMINFQARFRSRTSPAHRPICPPPAWMCIRNFQAPT